MFNLTPVTFADRFMSPFTDIDREFDRFFFGYPASAGFGRGRDRFFATDIRREDGAYVLETDLPGFDKSDVSVEISDGVLTVKAEKTAEEKDGDGYIRRERRSEKYVRRFSLDNADEDNVTAAFDNGVLTVRVPEKAPVEPETRKIEIA